MSLKVSVKGTFLGEFAARARALRNEPRTTTSLPFAVIKEFAVTTTQGRLRHQRASSFSTMPGEKLPDFWYIDPHMVKPGVSV